MCDERRQQMVEQYEEAAISLLMDDYAEMEGARLLQEYEAAAQNGELPEIPAEFDEKCRELIDRAFAKEEHKTKLMKFHRLATKVAVIVLVLFSLSTVTVLSVDAFRIPVLNFLMDRSGMYSTVVFDKNFNTEDSGKNSVVTRFEINLPEEYVIIHNTFEGTEGMIYSTNSSERIIYLEIAESDCGLNVDTEDQVYQAVDFCGYTAAFQDKDGYCLMWLDEITQTVYTLYANGLRVDAFWEFAYSLVD